MIFMHHVYPLILTLISDWSQLQTAPLIVGPVLWARKPRFLPTVGPGVAVDPTAVGGLPKEKQNQIDPCQHQADGKYGKNIDIEKILVSWYDRTDMQSFKHSRIFGLLARPWVLSSDTWYTCKCSPHSAAYCDIPRYITHYMQWQTATHTHTVTHMNWILI